MIKSSKPPYNGESRFNELTVRAPDNIPVGRYEVAVNNGLLNGVSGNSSAPEKLEISEGGPDTFNIGTAWSAELKFGHNIFDVKTDHRLTKHAIGDGKTNDQPAIQAAITAASECGGGVVFLPEGRYLLSSNTDVQLKLAKNVVIRGQSETSTKLLYGVGKPPKGFVFARFHDVSKCGLCDLAIENLNEKNSWLNTKSISNEGGKIDRVFLARVTVELRNGFRVELKGDRIAIKGCTFHSDYSTLHLEHRRTAILKRTFCRKNSVCNSI